jgi:ATP-dependent DNA helicase RecG
LLNDKYWWQQLVENALENKAEYNFLDFKAELSDKNERLKEHINAFGNLKDGGCFVFGVKNFVPVGMKDDWDSVIQKIAHLANTTQEPILHIDAFPLTIKNQLLLCIHILPGESIPVFIKDRAPLAGSACFKRSGSSTVAMSVEEIKDLLIHTQTGYHDESTVHETELNALDFEKLLKHLPALDKTNPWSLNNLSILMDNRILKKVNHSPHITVAGWLCFAKTPQEKREFRNSYIEFQIFQGTSRSEPIKKYDIKGNLPTQIEQSIQLLQQNIWHIPKIQGAKREDIPAYSDVILREVITNSLVHRDYKKMHQPVKIAMFSNRIEIENPGGLMPGLTIYNLIHKRDWRNPLLAELMKKFGFGEMDGQGIDRLYAATLSIKVPPPVFVDHRNAFTVILSAPKQYEEFTPEEKRLMIIILVIMNNTVDNESVRNVLGISREKASTLIKTMVADKVLQSNNVSRKYAKYILTDQYQEKISE